MSAKLNDLTVLGGAFVLIMLWAAMGYAIVCDWWLARVVPILVLGAVTYGWTVYATESIRHLPRRADELTVKAERADG